MPPSTSKAPSGVSSGDGPLAGCRATPILRSVCLYTWLGQYVSRNSFWVLGAAEALTEALDDLAPLGLQQMTVIICGHSDRAVPQHLGDDLQVVAEVDQHGGEAVPQVVEATLGEASLL